MSAAIAADGSGKPSLMVRKDGIEPAITRFPAQELEHFVTSQVQLLLQTPAKCTVGMKNSPAKGAATERAQVLARQWPKLETSRQHEFTETRHGARIVARLCEAGT